MDKLKVLVGLLYTQLMFCDKHGRLQFYRVITNADRPWTSIKEVLRMVKEAFALDKPADHSYQIESVQIDIQYWKIHFSSILQTLRGEMQRQLSDTCKLFIKTIREPAEMVEERTWRKVGDQEAVRKASGPREAAVLNFEQVKKEQVVPMVNSEYGKFKRTYKPFESLKGRRIGCQLLLVDARSLLTMGGGRPTWKNVNDLRGSPHLSQFPVKKKGGEYSGIA